MLLLWWYLFSCARIGCRWGQTQPPYSAPLWAHHEYWSQLVLSLRLHAAFGLSWIQKVSRYNNVTLEIAQELIHYLTECHITCHTKCAHLVPDFCGLSMEMANQMLAEIKAAAKRKPTETASKPQPPKTPTAEEHTSGVPDRSSAGSLPSLTQESLSSDMSQLSLQSHNVPAAANRPAPMPMPQPQPQPQHMGHPGYPPQQQPPQQYYPQAVRPPSMPQVQPVSPYAPIPNPAVMGRPMYNPPQQQPYPVMDAGAPRVSPFDIRWWN